MSEIRDLTAHVVEQVAEANGDRVAAFSDLAARLDPRAGELVDAWLGVNRTILAEARVNDIVSEEIQRDIFHSWLGSLRQRKLSQFYEQAAAWVRQLASAGLAYDRSLDLFRNYQRILIPFLARVYPAGPELEAALGGLDDLFNGARVLIGAVFIELLDERKVGESRAHALGYVFGGAAHALNNLLTVVLGRMALMIEQTRDVEAREELLRIQESAAAGAQMLGRLQDFMRSDRSEDPVAVQVNLLMRDAAEVTRFLWRDLAETNGVVIDVVKDFADVPLVQARPAELREAFVIMIVNAVEALPQGGLITLRTERQGESVLSSVVNSSQVSENAPRISAPFFVAGNIPGTAIRLSAAAKTAADLGGSFSVETAAERGTIFTLSLPVSADVGEERKQVTMTTHPADILFIDNEPGVRDAFTRLMALYGHRVTTAENGERGIAAFKAGRFDVVFTDLGMPGLSGWDVAREIKRLNPQALLVLVTGWPIEISAQKSKESGVDRVVTKPLDMPTVLGLIEDAVVLQGKG